MRRLYEERTQIAVQDIKDQPAGKYVAFFEGAFGPRSAITFDKLEVGPGVVTFVRVENPEAIKPKAELVAAVPIESTWGIIDYKLLLMITGAEWEEFKREDGKNQEAVHKKVFGEGEFQRVLMLPDGRVLPMKNEPTDQSKLDEALGKAKAPTSKPEKTYDDTALYR